MKITKTMKNAEIYTIAENLLEQFPQGEEKMRPGDLHLPLGVEDGCHRRLGGYRRLSQYRLGARRPLAHLFGGVGIREKP